MSQPLYNRWAEFLPLQQNQIFQHMYALRFLIFLLLPATLEGQKTAPRSSTQLRQVLVSMDRLLPHKQRDSIDFYRSEIIRLLPDITDPALRIAAYSSLGDYFQTGYLQLDSANIWYLKALDEVTLHPDPASRMKVLSRIAKNYYMQSRFTVAENFALESLDLSRKLGERRQEATCLSILASIMTGFVNEPQKALAYQQAAHQILQSLHDTTSLLHNYISLAIALNDLAKPDEALKKLDSARTLLLPSVPLGLHAELSYWRGYILLQQKNYDEALVILQQTLPLYESLHDRGRIMHILLDFGAIHLAKGQPDKTIAYCRHILGSAELNAGLYESTGAYQLLYEAYKKKGDAVQALRYHELYAAIQDTTRRINKDKDIAELEMRYENKEKALQLKQQELALQLSDTRQRNILIGLLLALAALGSVLYALRRVRKASQRLAEQNEVIRVQKEALQQADELKSRFFANVSHELRTPLTLMLGPLSSMLKGNRLEIRDFSYAKVAQQHGQQLLQLVNEILDLSKMESGKMKLYETTVSLQPFLRRLVSAFESHAERLDILFVFEYQLAERLRVLADEDKLQKVMNNLLANALKFTPAHGGGSVKVQVSEASGHIRIAVRDTGRGIHPDDVPHVFERFYQTAQADTPMEGGTGIGLALCREFADLMQGRIWVESTWGEGSRFYFEFPKKEVLGVGMMNDELEMMKEVSPHDSSFLLPPSSLKTVLLVEDNDSLRDYVKSILSEKYHVVTATHGQEALAFLNSTEAERIVHRSSFLIISDIMMPVMDGFQLLEALKGDDRWRSIPVVMLTARADMRDKLRALRIGVDDYLLKPFEEDELLARVENLLKNQAERVMSDEAGVMSDEVGVMSYEVGVMSDEVGDMVSNPKPGAEHITHHSYLITSEEIAWLEAFEQLVNQRLGDFHLTADMLAEAMAMSRAPFFRQLKRLTGLTPAQYLDEARFQKARGLFENRESSSVKAVAYTVGFRQVKHFSQNYKKRFGKLPSEYVG